MAYPPIHYSDYLAVDELMQLQRPKSEEYGIKAHDEMLFIVIHQVYELWFKQILFEIDSIIELFSQEKLNEQYMLTTASRLQRVIEIQKLLIDQVGVLETMTPMDFLEFRDFLYPASGFQSLQFRLIENKLGLVDRLTYNKKDYGESLKEDHRKEAKASESNPSLFSLLELWLERAPFVSSATYNFWQDYKLAVESRLKNNQDQVHQSDLDDESKKAHIKNIEMMRRSFHSIFDESEYQKLQEEGHWRLSYKALQSALFIHLYRHEPLLQLPYDTLSKLQTIDENFTQWRHRHAQMAHRMLGAKMGTGGSSGHKYLRAASNKHKVFSDFFNLATFFIPKSDLPTLPKEILEKMRFS